MELNYGHQPYLARLYGSFRNVLEFDSAETLSANISFCAARQFVRRLQKTVDRSFCFWWSALTVKR